MPIDLVVHTPGGLVLASEQIARALHKHPAKVTVLVPHYAMSGGTLLALAADEIVMDDNAVLGPVDPQIGQWPAASIIKVAESKPIERVERRDTDPRRPLAQGQKQIKEFVLMKLLDDFPADRANELADKLSSGQWTHDYPLTIDQLAELGLPVKTELPREVYDLMDLYPQSGSGRRCSTCRCPTATRRALGPVQAVRRDPGKPGHDLRSGPASRAGLDQRVDRLERGRGLGGASSAGPTTSTISPRAPSAKRSATSRAVPRTTSSCSFVSSRHTATSRSGSSSGAHRKRARQPSRRLERDQRLVAALELGAQVALLARQEAGETPALGGQPRRDQRCHDGRRAGSTSTGRPRAMHSRTSTNPGSDTPGVPASLTSATCRPSATRSCELARAAALVVLVEADQPRLDPMAVEQLRV